MNNFEKIILVCFLIELITYGIAGYIAGWVRNVWFSFKLYIPFYNIYYTLTSKDTI